MYEKQVFSGELICFEKLVKVTTFRAIIQVNFNKKKDTIFIVSLSKVILVSALLNIGFLFCMRAKLVVNQRVQCYFSGTGQQ